MAPSTTSEQTLRSESKSSLNKMTTKSNGLLHSKYVSWAILIFYLIFPICMLTVPLVLARSLPRWENGPGGGGKGSHGAAGAAGAAGGSHSPTTKAHAVINHLRSRNVWTDKGDSGFKLPALTYHHSDEPVSISWTKAKVPSFQNIIDSLSISHTKDETKEQKHDGAGKDNKNSLKKSKNKNSVRTIIHIYLENDLTKTS